MGPESSVRVTCFGLECPGIESGEGVTFYLPIQTGPVVNPLSPTMGTGHLNGDKAASRLKKEYSDTSIPAVGLRDLW
jgi:hypothetical protein